jgi:uncharacterized membrane protein
MDVESLGGLPAHPLLVHIPVVLIPLVAIGALLVAIRPKWMARYGWLLLILSGVAMVGAILAAGSGEALEEQVRETPAVERHAELGETARNVSILLFVVVAAVVILRWWASRRASEGDPDGFSRFVTSTAGLVIAGLLLVGTGAVATYSVVKAGHQGAEVTWEDIGEEGGG